MNNSEAQNTTFSRARDVVFGLGGLTDSAVDSALGELHQRRVDDGEFYFQTIKQESWLLQDGAVASSSFKLDQGVGVRAVAGERQAYAYSQDVTAESLMESVRAVRSIAAAGQARRIRVPTQRRSECKTLYEAIDPAMAFEASDKVAFLQRVHAAASSLDPRVVSVSASLGINFEVVYIVRADGARAADIRPLIRLQVEAIVNAGKGRYEMGRADVGGRYGLSQLNPEDIGRQAASAALECIDARSVAGGEMPVVLAAGWPGILVHEAVGHGLEADHIRKGMSLFKGRMGQRIANNSVSIVDNATIPGNRGSLAIDDEGQATSETMLIEDGILRGVMLDRLSARLAKTPFSCNARRQTYAHPPLPRMSNTYMLPGPYSRDEVLASLQRGLYVTRLGSGQVDITSGQFVFTTAQAYWVEGGRILHPVTNVTLAGQALSALNRVSMVGDDLQFDTGGGVCSKQGQHLPVSVGQPTIRVDSMVVGGHP